MIKIGKSLKNYTADADKAVSPEETVSRAKSAFEMHDRQILSELKRIDTGRLNIPVYLSICGETARESMPTRKQMGKGSTPVQAQASALMELAERYSYFSFVQDEHNFKNLTWNDAVETIGSQLISIDEIIKSTGEDISAQAAAEVLSLVKWQFTPATLVGENKGIYVPFTWFKKLNEFNGCSAGNSYEESILQGCCELIERHCCALVDSNMNQTATIDQHNIDDPVLQELLSKFTSNGIKVWLKDFTLDMPVPTVAAIAYDPATFPGLSEIVYTAGTATSPAKAAIRALTEVAQLAGDFHSGSNYEASGLPKYTNLKDIQWLIQGPTTNLDALPDISHQDMGQELMTLCRDLRDLGYNLYSIPTLNKNLNIPANYNFIPGFRFRERTTNTTIGMITGRILAEDTEPLFALDGLDSLSRLYQDAFFIPFYQGMVYLRLNDFDQAMSMFNQAQDQQPDNESRALCSFYNAYTLSLQSEWPKTIPYLNMAIDCDPLVKEYFNLRGVAFFKQKNYEKAAHDFQKALDLDSGSATDLANLGLCYLNIGQKKAAVETLSQALELDPNLEYAKKGLAQITL
ncbi:MAG: tetratricopeptide repeat protein [Desulfonatronovibrio sp. MSAO_Bac4]|nr:MAG: tetratricopeptide repeat protein [Desulfonatronovibrio sp. MSAO_Bac4]